MYTLNPEKKYADDWFRKITQYAVVAELELPFLKDQDGKYVSEYIGDAMRELITKILSNDPSITSKVREELEKDLKELMEKNHISQSLSIEKKASMCVQLMSAFSVEVARLLVITGNGLARAFGGSKLFQLAGKLVDKVEGVVSKIPLGTRLAKGLGALCVVRHTYHLNDCNS